MISRSETSNVLSHVYKSYGDVPAVWLGFISRLIENITSKCIIVILFAKIITALIHKDVHGTITFIWVTAITLLATSFINSLGDHYFVKYTDHKYKELVGNFHKKLLSKDIAYFRLQSTARIHTVFRDYMDGTIRIIRLFRGEILSFLASLIFPVIVLLFYNSTVALIVFAIGLVELIFTNWGAYKVKVLRKDALRAYKELTQEITDQILNISIVKASAEEESFNALISNLATHEEKLFTQRHTFEAFVEFLKGGLIASGIIVTLYVIITLYGTQNGTIEITIITILYLLQINLTISNSPDLYKKFYEHIGRVAETLDINTQKWEVIKDHANLKPIPSSFQITLKDVTFDYGPKEVFHNLSFEIPDGKHCAITGISGSGKSTFAQLLMRFDDITQGTITIGGTHIQELSLKSLRDIIAYVPQQPVLFNRTIRENIKLYVPDASDEQMIEASKQAQAHNFITTLKKGYDLNPGELGSNLSGGQKQRIAIARALLKKDAQIFIFDEITSALDKNAVKSIVIDIMKYLKGKTVLFMTHNPEIIAQMDMEINIENLKSHAD